MAAEDHSYGLPTNCFPRIEVVGVPESHPILALLEDLLWLLATNALLADGEQVGDMFFQPCDHLQRRFRPGLGR